MHDFMLHNQFMSIFKHWKGGEYDVMARKLISFVNGVARYQLQQYHADKTKLTKGK